ncbi:hypothetical protein RA307_17310 [Xanthobacteraceae bacterium Astr-EGSB]|uniref:hypothetical protein n=1 Tax=Astrobacterium formosum TaxID=3069710 RepID=UPI0027B2D594|nr:hypothetical protein [Xanthobacteraceae bacterium Astr-EGSB]
MVMFGVVFVGVPIAIMLAWMPFWEHVGDMRPLKQLNTIIAPELTSASSPRERRFIVGLASMVEMLLFANFLSLLSRRVRRHALMVWACFDRGKIILYLAASGIAFGALWYVIFCDWRPLAFVFSHGGAGTRAGSLFLYVAVSVPLVTVLFGQLMKIVILGLIRGAERAVRVRLRRRRTLCDLSR